MRHGIHLLNVREKEERNLYFCLTLEMIIKKSTFEIETKQKSCCKCKNWNNSRRWKYWLIKTIVLMLLPISTKNFSPNTLHKNETAKKSSLFFWRSYSSRKNRVLTRILPFQSDNETYENFHGTDHFFYDTLIKQWNLLHCWF